MIVNIDITEEHLPILLDRMRHWGALEIDNGSEETGVMLRDLADRIERSQEPVFTVTSGEDEETVITDRAGNTLTYASELDFVSVQVGPVEYTVDIDGEQNVNACLVPEASIWLDRRAATDVELDIRVAKLQDQPEVAALLTRLKEELDAQG